MATTSTTTTTTTSGSSGSDTLTASSSGSTISAGSGDDTLIGGSGSDKLSGDAGNDVFFYNISQNSAGTQDIYSGGANVDTVVIEFTLAQWLDAANQQQVADYLVHLQNVTNTTTGTVSNGSASDFTFQFGASTLTLQMMERLRVIVDGVELTAANDLVSAVNDSASATEDGPAINVDVLANDSVPDLVKDLAVTTGPSHGTATLVKPDTATPSTWYFRYLPDTSYFQYLAVGESATDTFSYRVTDANGDSSVATVTVTITGANDAPTISAAVGTGSVTEDASPTTLTSTGTITFDDLDLSDTHGTAVAPDAGNTLGGTLTASVTTAATGAGAGTVTWNYSVANSATQYLAAGQTATESFNVTISDGHGGTVVQTVTVTVTGANDAPTISAAVATGSVTEDASPTTLTSTGTITFDDLDLSDVHSTNVAPDAGNTLGGTLTASVTTAATGAGAGTVTWNYSVANSATQYLAAGQTATESFNVTISDGHGGTVAQTITVTVTGANDAPTISAAVATGSVTEDASPTTLTSTGTITFDDLDLTDIHGTTVTPNAGNTLGGTLTASVTTAATGAGAGTVTWNYSVANSATQYLAAGQTATESFNVTISDGHGGTVVQTVTVTVTGANDAPTISAAVATGSVTEDASPTTLTSTGTITFDDLDLSDVHGTSVAPDAGNTLGGTLTASVTTAATGAGAGTVTWNYSVANSATQYLAAGQTATESFNVTISDGHGGTVAQTITVTVTGTNDAPTISAAVATGSVTEDASPTTLSSTGTITFDDLDLSDVHGTSVAPDAGNTLGGTLTASVTTAATGAGAGTVTWNYSVANSATQYLAAGQTASESFDVTISDGHGGTVTQAVTVTVTGTNDAPTISAAVDTGSVTEDASPTTLTSTGTITFDDLDLIDTHGTTVTPDAGNTLGGSLTASVTTAATGAGAGTVTWNYNVANSATQYLAAGQTATESFNVTISDGHGGTVAQTVTVTVTGTNDAPTISAAVGTGSVTEDASPTTLTSTGTITFDDLDLTDTHGTTVTPDAGNTLGGSLTATVTTAATGAGAGTVTWNYNVANSATQYLAAGQAATESFNVTISDGHSGTVTQTVTVTVTGTNDAPTISAATDTGSVTEDASPITLISTGTITFDDLDLTDTHGTTVTPDAGNTLGGSLTASVTTAATGAGAGTVTWNYNVANSATQYLAAGQTATETFNVTISDGHGGTVAQTVTVTVTGTNDAPTISAATATGSVTEDASQTTLTSTGTITFDDLDVIDTHDTTVTPDAGNTLGGTLTANVTSAATGAGAGTVTWNYSLANSATQYLAAGQTATESFDVTISDGHSGTVTQTVTVTVTGTNDAPTISAATDTGSVTEDASPITLISTGTITFDDLDLTDTHGTTVTPDAGNTLGGTLTATVTTAATGAGAGTVTWNYSVSNAAVQSLNSGDAVTETFTVAISDGKGGTVNQTVTVTVHGVDDGPVGPVGGADNIITNVAVGTAFVIPEWALLANDTLTAGGSLDIALVSNPQGLTVTHTAGTGSNGSLSIVDLAPAGGSFVYQPTDGTNPSTSPLPVVTVSQDLTGSLDGTAGNDILVSANSSGTSLKGGAGDDILLGGSSNDTYVFGLADGKDTIADAGGGNDAIQIVTAAPTNSTGIDTLNFEMVGSDLVILVGATAITVKNHTGTGSVESISFTNGGLFAGYTIGTSAYKIGTGLSGTGQEDVIASSVSGQALTGGNGNDLLFGNGGADTIDGGNGADLVVGGAGADRLLGGDGNDVLLGGAGNDVFVFNTALGASNVDKIQDFDANGGDTIELSAARFAGIAIGASLAATDFSSVSGTGATANVGAGVNIIYDSASGNLYYDSDGGGSANRTLFATVTVVGGTFDNADFVVVA